MPKPASGTRRRPLPETNRQLRWSNALMRARGSSGPEYECAHLAYRGDALRRRGNNPSQTFRRFEPGQLVRRQPMRLGQFFVKRNFARNPACGERQNDEMPLDASAAVARDGLPKAGELDRLDLKRGFFADFANDGFLQGLAKLDAPAGQRVKAAGGWARPAPAQHPAVAENRGSAPKKRARRISSRIVGIAH